MRRRVGLPGAGVLAVCAAMLAALAPASRALAAGSAPGAPGASATWNEANLQGFADALGSASKVWYTLGNGELENAFYPQTDTPDTFGLQYLVSDGTTFTDSETAGTTHRMSLADPTSLVWQQANTAPGQFTIAKTYVADPSRPVVLVQTTFTNLTPGPLSLYADYLPQLSNDGMGNTGGTDSASGDLVASNGPVSSALAASVSFSQATTGYVGSASDGSQQLASGHVLGTTYSSAATAGHIVQVAQIPVAASGSTTFTLALGFGATQAAAVSAVSASLAAGFGSLESSFEAGWHSWLAGLHAPPASVTGSPGLQAEYDVSLMELKADEDKTFTGAFIASPTTPWGTSVSANSGGGHGYHVVWTRDEYEMASALLAAGDTSDATDALHYILSFEEQASGAVKQNSFLDGTPVFGSLQMDEVADPLILAWQLGDTGSADWPSLQKLANYLVSNGPSTPEERWEETGGYSPATMAAEIAGLVCASVIATANGDTTGASAYLSTADSFRQRLDSATYTTTGPYGGGDYYLRITPDGAADAGTAIGIANGGGSHDDRSVTDQSFLEAVRLGIEPAGATEITSTLPVVDSQLKVTTPGGPIWHRYNFDGYGETASGADFTGAGVGNVWPVLSGERGEYDVAAGDLAGAQSLLATMAGAANSSYQIPEQDWAGSTGTGGFTFGQPDNSATPLMWALAQYVRLAIDISAGHLVDTPSVVAARYAGATAGTGGVSETVNLTVPVSTDATGENVYLNGNFSVLGEGAPDWSPSGIAMTRVNATHWTATVHAAAATTLAYKYTLGGSWDNVEQTASCGFVSNRGMPVNGGTVSDAVATWAGPFGCGPAQAVINVTVPASTPSGATVYLSGNYSALGTGMKAGQDWAANEIPMTKTGASTWSLTVAATPGTQFQYKFDLGTWANVEETGSCGFVNNHTFGFGGAGSSFTAGNTVAAWAGLGGC
jgi:glucoamylase